MLLAMSEIVFQVVPLGLESSIILVFDVPPGSPSLNNFGHGVIGDGVAGHEGIVISHPTIRTAYGVSHQFTNSASPHL